MAVRLLCSLLCLFVFLHVCCAVLCVALFGFGLACFCLTWFGLVVWFASSCFVVFVWFCFVLLCLVCLSVVLGKSVLLCCWACVLL